MSIWAPNEEAMPMPNQSSIAPEQFMTDPNQAGPESNTTQRL